MDLRIIKMLDVLPVTKVDMISYSPQTLELTGRNYQNTQSVFVNDVSMPLRSADDYGYTILSPSVINVELPLSMLDVVINRVVVFGNTDTLYETASIEFNLLNFTAVSGLSGVVQQFLKLFLTSPGTDRFKPTSGGGVKNMAGVTLDDQGRQGIAAKLMLSAKKCAAEIRASQTSGFIPPEERLVDVIIGEVGFRTETGTTEIRLEVETEAQHAVVKVGV